MVNATPRPLYPQERPSTPCIAGWVGPRASLDRCGNSHPQDRPVHSKSLFRLSYPGPRIEWNGIFEGRIKYKCCEIYWIWKLVIRIILSCSPHVLKCTINLNWLFSYLLISFVILLSKFQETESVDKSWNWPTCESFMCACRKFMFIWSMWHVGFCVKLNELDSKNFWWSLWIVGRHHLIWAGQKELFSITGPVGQIMCHNGGSSESILLTLHEVINNEYCSCKTE